MTNHATIHGVQPILEALRAGREIESILLHRARSGATQKIVEQARSRGVPIVETSRAKLAEQSGTERNQGVVALLRGAAVPPMVDLDALLARAAEAEEPPLLLLLDGIQDPHNLGALIRTAHALGAHGVVIPKKRAAPVNATVVKASAGATAHLPICQVTNIKHAIERLQKAGVWCAAAVLEGDPAHRCRLDGPLALVIGGEGKGVRRSVAEHCDLRVRIELARAFDSLNASVAGGILLYEVVRQRSCATPP